jgi:hypothetical protein
MAPDRRFCRQGAQYLPSAYFQAVPYIGNATASTAVPTPGNSNLRPDLVWIKNRDQADQWNALDTERGATKSWKLDDDAAQATDTNGLTAFSATDGFTLGTGAGGYNDNAEDFISYMWEEGVLPGLDIVSFVGNATNRTIGHSLGVTPDVMMVKNVSSGGLDARVYHKDNTASPETDALSITSNAATLDLNTFWNDTAPTSSVFSVGTHNSVNKSSDTIIAHLWAEVPGFSRFGVYEGNSSADGPMIYCGFRPAFVLVKRTNTTGNWVLRDSGRDFDNATNAQLWVDLPNAESASDAFDFCATGFKLRSSGGSHNLSGSTYIFMAFAEAPFKYANAR